MAFPQGIDFRSTAGFVVDPTGCDKEIGSAANYFHTTVQGNNVGWTIFGTGNTRDRLAGNDPRIAGMAFNNAIATCTYRIDLPSAGSYDIRIALGDGSYSRACKCELFDNTTSLGVLASGTTGAANSFFDATGVVRTAAAWPGSNVAVTKVFATTTCLFVFGTGAATDSFVAHVNVAASGGGGPTAPFPPWPDKQNTMTQLRM